MVAPSGGALDQPGWADDGLNGPKTSATEVPRRRLTVHQVLVHTQCLLSTSPLEQHLAYEHRVRIATLATGEPSWMLPVPVPRHLIGDGCSLCVQGRIPLVDTNWMGARDATDERNG